MTHENLYDGTAFPANFNSALGVDIAGAEEVLEGQIPHQKLGTELAYLEQWLIQEGDLKSKDITSPDDSETDEVDDADDTSLFTDKFHAQSAMLVKALAGLGSDASHQDISDSLLIPVAFKYLVGVLNMRLAGDHDHITFKDYTRGHFMIKAAYQLRCLNCYAQEFLQVPLANRAGEQFWKKLQEWQEQTADPLFQLAEATFPTIFVPSTEQMKMITEHELSDDEGFARRLLWRTLPRNADGEITDEIWGQIIAEEATICQQANAQQRWIQDMLALFSHGMPENWPDRPELVLEKVFEGIDPPIEITWPRFVTIPVEAIPPFIEDTLQALVQRTPGQPIQKIDFSPPRTGCHLTISGPYGQGDGDEVPNLPAMLRQGSCGRPDCLACSSGGLIDTLFGDVNQRTVMTTMGGDSTEIHSANDLPPEIRRILRGIGISSSIREILGM